MVQQPDQHPLIVLIEDEIIHTDEHPFCSIDPICPCHEDQVLLAEVQEAVHAGLLTPEEATRFAQGHIL